MGVGRFERHASYLNAFAGLRAASLSVFEAPSLVPDRTGDPSALDEFSAGGSALGSWSPTILGLQAQLLPIGHSIVQWFAKPNGDELKLEFLFDPTGREIGTRVLEPEPVGVLGPPRLQGDSDEYAVPRRWRPNERLTDSQLLDRIKQRPADANASLIFLARLYLLRGKQSYDVVRRNDAGDASYTFWFRAKRLEIVNFDN